MKPLVRCVRTILFASALASGAASADDLSNGSRPPWLRPLSLNVLAEVRHVSQGVVSAYNSDTDDEVSSAGLAEMNQVIRETKIRRIQRGARFTELPAIDSTMTISGSETGGAVQLGSRDSQLKEQASKWAASMRSKAEFLEVSVNSKGRDSTPSVNELMRIQRAAVFRRMAEALDRSTNEEGPSEGSVDLSELELGRTEFPNFRFQDPTPTMIIPSFRDDFPRGQ